MSFLFRVFTLKKFLHVCAEGNQRTRIFSAVLYMVSKTQRQPKYPSLVRGVCLYSGIVSCNKNELQFQETKQINLKDMLLSSLETEVDDNVFFFEISASFEAFFVTS